jgi:hypothetical protein
LIVFGGWNFHQQQPTSEFGTQVFDKGTGFWFGGNEYSHGKSVLSLGGIGTAEEEEEEEGNSNDKVSENKHTLL